MSNFASFGPVLLQACISRLPSAGRLILGETDDQLFSFARESPGGIDAGAGRQSPAACNRADVKYTRTDGQTLKGQQTLLSE